MSGATLNRRKFLKYTGGMTVGVIASPAWGLNRVHAYQDRSLSFYNLHTGERLNATYWADGRYQRQGLVEINRLLRDYRTDQVKRIDLGLLELLYDLHQKLGAREAFHVISGYRSPQTNAMLHSHSSGVAKKSLHMEGKAIDIRLPGVDLERLHRRALSLRAGGVGYYPKSDFVHVDVGRVRRWYG